jgi:uncharacterized protein (UPF0333 family)
MKHKKKAQIALEYMILIGFILAALTPLVYSQLNKYMTKQRISDTYRLANNIAKSSDSLYSLGPGNQKYMYINVPKGISNVNIYQREISFTVETQEGEQDIILLTKGYITGVIPITPGTHQISMRVLGNGVVLIGVPYCGVMPLEDCELYNLNPLVYLQGAYSSHVNLYSEGTIDSGETISISDYGICCKDSVEMIDPLDPLSDEEAIIFWLNSEINSHVSLSNFVDEQENGYNIPLRIKPVTPGNPINCISNENQDIDFCAEFGFDYLCIATLENNYINNSSDDGIIILNSHISDCDGDYDDYPIKICCNIPS